MLTIEQKVLIKRAIKSLDEALFKFQQDSYDPFHHPWLEEIREVSLALEDMLENNETESR